MSNRFVECILCFFFKFLVLSAELSGVAQRVAATEKDVDNQSREVATLRGVLSTTETQVQLQKIIVEDLEKAKTGEIPKMISFFELTHPKT